MSLRWIWGCCLLALACGQSEKRMEPGAARPLARVAGAAIGEAEFRSFVAKQSDWEALPKKGAVQIHEYLQPLVDRALLLREARTLGLDQRPETRNALEWAFTQRLAQEVDRREVQPKVTVSDAEVEERFRSEGWGRQLKVAHIFTRTRQRGEEALAALGRGQSFAAVAQRLSEDPPSAERGGEMPYYYGRANATRAVRDALFRLQVGQVSGLVPIGKGFEIFKVLDERRVEFAKVESKVRQELTQERLVAQGQARFGELAAAAGLEPQPEGLGRLVAVLRQGPQEGRFVLPAADLELALYRDHQGAVTVGDAISQSSTIRQGRGLEDSLRLVEVLHAEVLAPRILAQRARELKLDSDPSLVTWRQHKEEDFLITQLRQQATGEVAVSEAEARAYYQAHLERYRNPEATDVVEVLLNSEAEAREVLAQYEADRSRLGPLTEVLGAAAARLPDRAAAAAGLQRLASLPVAAGEPAVLARLRLKASQPATRVQLLDDLARAAGPQQLAEEYLFRQLAVAYSQRVESGPLEGCYRLYWYEQARFGDLVEQAMAAPVGAVLGPVPVDSLYSVAKVVGRQGAKLRPFEEVGRQLRARLLEERRNEAFGRWLEELRQRGKGEVEYLEANIEALAQVLAQEGPPTPGGKP